MDFVYVLKRETGNVSKPVVVDTVQYRHLKRCSHASRGDVLQGLAPHRHVVSQPAMFVLFFRHSVDLQVDTMEAIFPRLQSEIPTLSEQDAVCCSVKQIEANAFRVPIRIKQTRRFLW